MRKITSLLVGLCAAAAAGGAFGQVHKCEVNGKTVYQDMSCAGAGVTLEKPVPVEKVDPSYEGPGKALCLREAPRFFKDPESLKIGTVFYYGTEKTYRGLGRRYVLTIDGKNSYGAYAGAQRYKCYVTMDEKELIAFGK